VAIFAEGLKENTTLTELFMTHNDLSGMSGETFIKSLSGKPQLKSLALNNCKIGLKEIKALGDVLRDNDQLKELYLYSNKLGPSEAVEVAKIIASKRKLTALGLSNNQIGTEGAMHLASTALADKLALTKLSLEGNSIGSRGLRAISEAMMANTELKEIYLYNNQIEDDGLEIFGKMI
jgi:NLR family CARD domain-containing protein 3